MSDRLRWERDGADWPNRNASKFVDAAGLRWHVQQMGSGPALLLVHGTGSATHSWRALAPLLSRRFTVFAPDLPGHGFTAVPPRELYTLAGMSTAISDLLHACQLRPKLVVGHSAGAAILARMCLDEHISPQMLVGINAALLPMTGAAGRFFSPIAKLFACNGLVPRVFAWHAASQGTVERLIRSTGSSIEPRGVELYRRLVGNSEHAAAALAMMANWDLHSLARDLPRLQTPLLLLTGSRDWTVPPREAERIGALLPSTRNISLVGLGHLAHEEQPQRIADILISLIQSGAVTAK